MLETWFWVSLVAIAALGFIMLNCRLARLNQKIRLLRDQVKLLCLDLNRKDQYIAELQRRCERLKRNEQGTMNKDQGSRIKEQ
jgi:predicted RNase H-like nuclease (RuvC/YqgF family)